MIVAGFGFRGSATQASLADALRQTGHGGRVTHFATAADKAADAEFQNHAQDAGCPVCALTSAALAAVETPTQSAAAQGARGVGSLAEAAALAAAGPGARLLVTRVISNDRRASCAVAQAKGDGP